MFAVGAENEAAHTKVIKHRTFAAVHHNYASLLSLFGNICDALAVRTKNQRRYCVILCARAPINHRRPLVAQLGGIGHVFSIGAKD
jgi:hypothetical protein